MSEGFSLSGVSNLTEKSLLSGNLFPYLDPRCVCLERGARTTWKYVTDVGSCFEKGNRKTPLRGRGGGREGEVQKGEVVLARRKVNKGGGENKKKTYCLLSDPAGPSSL